MVSSMDKEKGSGGAGFIPVAIGLFLVWLMLTSTWAMQEVVTGLVISIVIGFLVRNRVDGIPRGMKRAVMFVAYIPYFMWQVVKANLIMTYYVLHPEMPIRPGIVSVKTKLTSDTGKLALANSITLTPGTLTMDVIDDTLYVHWIDVKGDTEEQTTRAIAGPFESFLRRIYP